jgi:hypothetical protein
VMSFGGESLPFPTTPQAHQQATNPASGAPGVAKLSGDGSTLVWGTVIGLPDGPTNARIDDIELGVDGCVFAAGSFGNPGWATTPGALSDAPSATSGHAFKLLSDGSGLVWSVALGGCCGGGQGYDNVSVDEAGQAWLLGVTILPGWPTTPDAYQQELSGSAFASDLVLTKLDTFGEQLDYSTYFGASNSGEQPYQVGVDELGRPRIAFFTDSGGLPTQPWVYQPNFGGKGDYAVAGFDIPARPWRVLGGGSQVVGSSPNLAAAGDQTPGAPTRFALRGAKPGAAVWLVAGGTRIDLQILGGTLIPLPGPIFPGQADAAGAEDWSLPWPSQALGTDLWFQAWCVDFGMPELFSWTNGMRALVIGG